MAEEHRHHIVSRGYQPFFADGELVLLCDKTRPARGPQVRPAGTSSVFVAEHFNSYRGEGRWITHLERAWRTVENPCLPSLRSWVNGNEWIEGGGSGLPSRDAAKLLAAIHFARSSFFKQIYDRISKEGLEWAVQVLPTDPELLLRWQRVFKSAPSPGQVEDEIRKNFDSTFGPHGRYVLERMVHTYELAITKLEQLHVQALITSQRGIDFILGDSPLVYYTEDELRVGGRSGVALGAGELSPKHELQRGDSRSRLSPRRWTGDPYHSLDHVKKRCDLHSCLSLGIRNSMSIQVQRDRDVGMAKDVADVPNLHAGIQSQGGKRA